MAVRSEFTTPGGTKLKLINLKGKEYLPVADRVMWFVEENVNYEITTEYQNLTEESVVAHTTVVLFGEGNKLIKKVTGTKQEDKKGFNDFIEKAQTGSLGRALAMLGYGTQFTADELDEGTRIVDAPREASVSPLSSVKTSNGFAAKVAKSSSKAKTANTTDL